ncbi:butyrate kinase [candidate division KSB1 bacterium]|nr:butyrate kinase [candidate division KSB1 bacterium]
MIYKILVINPGSTSTKVALFENSSVKFSENLIHHSSIISSYHALWDQFSFRLEAITEFINQHSIDLNGLSAIVGRGGLLKPVNGGTYKINSKMIADAKGGLRGHHASNLGCALAYELAAKSGVEAFIVDPVSTDEFEPLARYSGHPLIERSSLSHTLSIHAVGRQAARELHCDYLSSNFIIAHLGGGISICPLKQGRIIDVNDASSSGPFSPERTGELPLQAFIKLCFSGEYTEKQMKQLVMGGGGLLAYLGTADAMDVEQRITDGDEHARNVYQAMAYQIAKEIGAMSTVLKGDVKAIVISGGLAKSAMLVEWIGDRVKFIAPVLVIIGDHELEAMADGALRVLNGEEIAKEY